MNTNEARDFLLGLLEGSLNESEDTEDFVASLDEESIMYFDADGSGAGDSPWFIVTVRPARLVEA